MRATVAVLAGGRGSRIGGDKPLVRLGGRALIDYPLSAARQAGLEAVVVAKRATRLPPLDVPVLLEPDEPTHPLLGVITALEQYPAIIAIPCDMPFLEPADLAALAAMHADIALLTPNQPFPSLYDVATLPQLRRALEAGASMRSTQAQFLLAPEPIASMRDASQMTINTPEDLAAAERLIARR